TPLEWWTALVPHPKAFVLAFLGIKLFLVLANSMPNEHTGSSITWLNSPLRNCQTVETLMQMLKVGQQYGVHMKKAKEKASPTVNLTDINTVLNPATDVVKPGKLKQSGETEQSDQVKLIDLLPPDDEEEHKASALNGVDKDSKLDEVDIFVDIDMNIDVAILQKVVPKETTLACHSSRSPAIIAGILALDTSEKLDRASGNAANSGDFDWEAL
ncbi:hypothetical protein Moror_16582, partial [Moniliophthora roreri MCA 2997]